MARNGSGGYTQPVSNFVSGTTAVANDVNTWLADLGAEIANSIAADGQTQPTADLPMAGFKHTNVADATASSQYAAFGQVSSVAVSTQEGISVSAIDFTLPSGFRAFKITITDMAIGTDNTQIGLRTSVDGGISFSSGASDYNFRQLWNSTASAVSTSTGDTSLIPLSVAMDGSTLLIGEYIFFIGGASVAASLVGHSTYVDDGGGSAYGGIGLFGGRRNATGVVDAIRIFPSGGVLSGVVSLAGIR